MGSCGSFSSQWRPLVALGLGLCLSACGFLPSVGYRNPADLSTRTVVPHKLALSPYGNSPYTVDGHTYVPLKSAAGYRERGIASWYGRPFNGQKTSDGATYNMYAMTAASKVLPLPCYVRVRDLRNNRTVVVEINDRGPFYPHRIIDLSYAAAARLGMLGTGTAPVEVTGLAPGEHGPGGRRSGGVFGVHRRHVERPHPLPSHPHRRVFGVHRPPTAHPWYVQLGAFARMQDARRLRLRLHAKGLSRVHIFRRTVGGRRLYLLCVGPEPDKREARVYASRLTGDGWGPTLVVDP